MSRHPRPAGKPAARFSAKHIAGLFAFYAILAFCVLTFTFFYVFNMGELRLVTALTLAFAVVATVVHVKSGRRDRVDQLIDHGP
jgi:hypothetical protein